MKKIELKNGVMVPQIGYGTWIVENNQKGIESIAIALNNGYTHIDAAAVYGNEEIVGKGIIASNRKRSELFITSKVWNTEHGYDKTIKAFYKTLSDLNTDYLDLYLIHWPHPNSEGEHYVESLQETWRALEDLYKKGKVRAIGVSNCKIHHLEEIAMTSTITPMINQIEFHPSCLNIDLMDYCKNKNIQIEGYSIYGHGEAFKSKQLEEFAEKYNTNIGKICLQWALQKGIIALIKSNKKQRIIDNIKIDFILSDEDLKAIDNVSDVGGLYIDSDNCDF